MIKVQIHYTTIDGVKKSKVYSYVNPAASDVTIKDFANAMYSLTTNTTGDIYKIDTAILLDDDSDDIVTPIVTTEKQDPQLTATDYDYNEDDYIYINYLGDGKLSFSNIPYGYYIHHDSDNKYELLLGGFTFDPDNDYWSDGYDEENDEWDDADEYFDQDITVTLAETDEYYSDTATFNVYCEEDDDHGSTDIPVDTTPSVVYCTSELVTDTSTVNSLVNTVDAKEAAAAYSVHYVSNTTNHQAVLNLTAPYDSVNSAPASIPFTFYKIVGNNFAELTYGVDFIWDFDDHTLTVFNVSADFYALLVPAS